MHDGICYSFLSVYNSQVAYFVGNKMIIFAYFLEDFFSRRRRSRLDERRERFLSRSVLDR